MSKRYKKRAAELIKSQLSELLYTRVSDPRVKMITLTGVDVTPDTTQAHVYFSVIGGPEEQAEALAGLESAAGFLSRELGQRIRLRNTPKLTFHWDSAMERGERIADILDQLGENEPTEPGSSS